MRIHLITYGTRRFRHRQWLLGWSAKANQVVDTVSHWTPEKLTSAGFEERCPEIKLSDRGSGYWAWKPFIIQKKLEEVPSGDIVFYCDVGRLYPFKILDQPLLPYINWMREHDQSCMPGIEIPWDGSTSVWTKRETLIHLNMDKPHIHQQSPVQASFSIWQKTSQSEEFISQWMEWCSQKKLISDDLSTDHIEELPEFRGHRHDQALLTLCCLQKNMLALNLGASAPTIDSKHPSQVSRIRFAPVKGYPSMTGKLFRLAIWPIEQFEQRLRRKLTLGKVIHE